MKLPKIGLNTDESFKLNISEYTYDSPGLTVAPSFGFQDAIINGDPLKVSTIWLNASTITITALSAYTIGGPVDIDVIAALDTVAPFGVDLDKERIQVYRNLLANSTFSTSDDTTSYGYELSPGRTALASIGFSTSQTDVTGERASGILKINLASNQSGVKSTSAVSSRFNFESGQWYISRMRLFSPDSANNHQAQFFTFSNPVPEADHVDVRGYVVFGIPDTWTWIESPVYSFETGQGYPQFQIKAGGSGTVYIDQIQIINANSRIS